MDCCTGWTLEATHGDDCPVFNRAMDAMNTFETELRKSPDWATN